MLTPGVPALLRNIISSGVCVLGDAERETSVSSVFLLTGGTVKKIWILQLFIFTFGLICPYF